jgi:hypothetical protein
MTASTRLFFVLLEDRDAGQVCQLPWNNTISMLLPVRLYVLTGEMAASQERAQVYPLLCVSGVWCSCIASIHVMFYYLL